MSYVSYTKKEKSRLQIANKTLVMILQVCDSVCDDCLDNNGNDYEQEQKRIEEERRRKEEERRRREEERRRELERKKKEEEDRKRRLDPNNWDALRFVVIFHYFFMQKAAK